MNLLARIISILFHPLLMATYLFLLLSIALPAALEPVQISSHRGFILLIFIVTFLLPALNIGIFKMFGSIKSITMVDRSERIIPFSFISILYGIVTYLFYSKFRVGLNDNVLKFLMIIDILVLMATLITIFYKISVHSLAIWGFLGVLFPLNKVSEDGSLFIPTIVLIVVAGFVMSSRLQLNAHTPREVLAGAMVGFATSFTGMIILF